MSDDHNRAFIATKHRAAIRLLLVRFLTEFSRREPKLMSAEEFAGHLSRAAKKTYSKQVIKDFMDVEKTVGTNNVVVADIRDFLLRRFTDVDPATVGASATQHVAHAFQYIMGSARLPPNMAWSSNEVRFASELPKASLTIKAEAAGQGSNAADGSFQVCADLVVSLPPEDFPPPSDQPAYKYYHTLFDELRYAFTGHAVQGDTHFVATLHEFSRKLSVIVTAGRSGLVIAQVSGRDEPVLQGLKMRRDTENAREGWSPAVSAGLIERMPINSTETICDYEFFEERRNPGPILIRDLHELHDALLGGGATLREVLRAPIRNTKLNDHYLSAAAELDEETRYRRLFMLLLADAVRARYSSDVRVLHLMRDFRYKANLGLCNPTTPMHVAAYMGHAIIVNYLVSPPPMVSLRETGTSGPDFVPGERDASGHTPAEFSILGRRASDELVEFLTNLECMAALERLNAEEVEETGLPYSVPCDGPEDNQPH